MGSEDADRLKLIYESSLSALQGVVRELAITEDELHTAAEFFNRLGASGLFPSLLDLALAVTSINARRIVDGTRPNLEGPFYRAGAPLREDGVLYDAPPGPGAELCTLEGRVTDATRGEPIVGAEVDLWQTDDRGRYDEFGFNFRGVVRTDAEGRYRVTTVVPPDYPQHQADLIGDLLQALEIEPFRAAHIHLKVRAPGRKVLTTQFFIAGSPHLDTDYVAGAVSPDLVVPKIARLGPDGSPRTTLVFDISLPPSSFGDAET